MSRINGESYLEKIHSKIHGRYEYIGHIGEEITLKTRVILKCPIHGDGSLFENKWLPVASSVLNGYGCPKCAGKYRYSESELISLVEEKGFIFVNFISKVKGIQSKVNVFCSEHGEGNSFENKWNPTIANLVYHNKGCPKCAGVYRRTLNEWVNALSDTKYKFVKLGGDFKGKHTRAVVECPVHGRGDAFSTKWVPRFEDLIRGVGCPKCANLYNFSRDEYRQLLESMTPYNIIGFEGTNKSKHTKVLLKCEIHGAGYKFGTPWKPTINNLLRGGRCPKCTRSYVYSEQELVEKVNQLGGTEFKFHQPVIDLSRGVKSKIILKCLKANFFWETTPDCIFSGNKCPHCAETGFNKSKPAFFYLQRLIENGNVIALKIGITNNEPVKRMYIQSTKSEFEHQLIGYVYNDAGNLIYDFEANMLRDLKNKGASPFVDKSRMKDGYTETVCFSQQDNIVDAMKGFSEYLEP